jgi:uncharacterized caspase-like protein
LAVPQQERRVAPVAANDSGRRIALLVGNRDYTRTKALANPVNDATDLAAALRRAGFDVQLALNTSRRELERDIAEFTQRLRPGDAALFCFSGHGLQAEGEKYLLPVDFEALAEADVKYSAYPAARVLDNMKARGARINILILDACRDNPFRSLAAARAVDWARWELPGPTLRSPPSRARQPTIIQASATAFLRSTCWA